MKKKLWLTMVVMVVVLLGVTPTVYAWAFSHHSEISDDLGNSRPGYSDNPDTWGESHFGSTLNDKAETYLKKAITYYQKSGTLEWYYDYTAAKYEAYALHYIQDAGQPWHAANMGTADGDHIGYEVWALQNYNSGEKFVDDVKDGMNDPASWCVPSSQDNISEVVQDLQDATSPLYKYVDTESDWQANPWATQAAMYDMASCAKALMNYARSFDQ